MARRKKSHSKKAHKKSSKKRARKTVAKKSHRKSRAKKSRAKSYGRRARPVIYVDGHGNFHRPKKGRVRYFKKAGMKVNGRRHRKARKHYARRRNGTSIMSAIKNVFQVRTIAQYASIGGGLFAGTLLSKLLNTGLVPFTSYQLPASVTDTLSKVRPAHGLIHILAGTLLAAKSRNKYLKDAGIGLAALGGFDLLMQGLSMAGVKNLPTFSGMNVNLMGMTQYSLPNSAGGVPPRMSGMNVNLRGMNVDLMGDAWADECESNHLADNINDMVS